MLADILLSELEKHGKDFAPAHQHIVMLAKEIATKYKEQHETLAAIATMYVRTQYMLSNANTICPTLK